MIITKQRILAQVHFLSEPRRDERNPKRGEGKQFLIVSGRKARAPSQDEQHFAHRSKAVQWLFENQTTFSSNWRNLDTLSDHEFTQQVCNFCTFINTYVFRFF